MQPFIVDAGVGLTEDMAALVEKTKNLVLEQLKEWQAEPKLKHDVTVKTR